MLRWQKWKKKQKSNASEPPTEVLENSEQTQPYLQQKAELEDEERQRHEWESEHKVYELGTGRAKYEMPAVREMLNTEDLFVQSRQELRGEEYARELWSP